MSKAAFKALISLLTFSRAGGPRLNRDRIVLITSTAMTIGLVALYAYGKLNGRW